MSIDQEPHAVQEDDISAEKCKSSPEGPRSSRWMIGGVIMVVLSIAGYFSYGLIARSLSPEIEAKTPTKPPRVIQLDVLNGCGVKGAGARFTNYLRASGFDVVEMKNYKTFNIPQTLVIDRVGDLAAARRVAVSLGVSEKNVVQQLNPDYFVDVSVVVGEDFARLQPSR